MTGFHRPLGSLPGPGPSDLVSLAPEQAGWTYSGLRVLQLEAGAEQVIPTGGSECFVLPLAGSLELTVDDVPFSLGGRESVFTGVTDFAYAGRDSRIVLRAAAAATVALPSARCERVLPPRYGPAQDVPVETRGAGPASRQVRNFGTPGVWEHADRLVCCELITPPGNWSSYFFNYKESTEIFTVVNEEIYYFRIAGEDQITPSRTGFGLHGMYTGPEHAAAGLAPVGEQVQVRDGDVYLIPYGYHGPCVAAPGYPMYYLNVLAGPGAERSMAFCDDPAHGWIRDTWTG